SGLFYIEGIRIVAEAVQKMGQIESVIFAPELLTSDFGYKLIDQVKEKGINTLELTGNVFNSIALKENPQGIAAVVHQHWGELAKLHLGERDVWVALDSVADPGNLGTILRTLDAVGGKGIILLDQSTDPYDPTAIRSSMGSIFSLEIIKASFEDFAQWKKGYNYSVVGTSDKAETDYHDCVYPYPLILLMGSERQGLQDKPIQLCDQMVSIPMVGRSDSLNLAVATAVVLYEVFNQRRQPSNQ
ncbi:MAG: RNA methyltransferase, partial [Planctomycetes bacterium]|nr:RNA methyltransferase [Planctomycetota bacterium]